MNHKKICLFLSAFVFSCFASGQNTNIQNCINEVLKLEWQLSSPDSIGWIPATVPGSVHQDLITNGIIDDPFIGSNEQKCQWVEGKNWIYKSKPFPVSPEILSRKKVLLKLAGIDTYAEVFFNDEPITQCENAFRTWNVDITNKLKSEGNVIQINFESPIEEGRRKMLLEELPLPGDALRAVTRKPQYQFGWDWGPKLNTCGIGLPLEIVAFDYLLITDLYVEQKKIQKDKAWLNIQYEIEALQGCEAEIDMQYLALTTGSIPEDLSVMVKLKKGINQIALPLQIEYPSLWWCNGLGEQNLYAFYSQLKMEGAVMDEENVRAGLRNIDLITEKDSIGESFYFQINGKPVFAKGANYIPAKYFTAATNKADYEFLLEECKTAHFNMLRVWGGGVYEKDEFYDLCDEKGILIWHDFMFACSMYPGDSAFVSNVIVEADEQTKRLRSHPAMALWCGNNENSEGWQRWGWQDGLIEKQKNEIWQNYKDVFNRALPDVVSKNTNSPYWESSPKYGRGDKRHQFDGDAHYWGVWHDEEPFEMLRQKVPRFMSEFGVQSFPSKSVLREMSESDSVKLDDPGILQHQKHPRGFRLMNDYMKRWLPVSTQLSINDYAFLTQVVQSEGIGMAVEAQRLAQPTCMGTLFWQLNDVWPAFSWSAIDYKGHRKLLMSKLNQFYDPQTILVQNEDDKNLRVAFVNDQHSIADVCNFKLTFWNSEGKLLHQQIINLDSLPEGIQTIFNFTLSEKFFEGTSIDDLWLHAEWGVSNDSRHLEYQKSVLKKITPSYRKYSKPVYELIYSDKGFAIGIQTSTPHDYVEVVTSDTSLNAMLLQCVPNRITYFDKATEPKKIQSIRFLEERIY